MAKGWRIPIEQRFWEKVDKSGDCWLWTGRTARGYGTINLGGEHGGREGAHRLSWILHNGPIPSGLFVCHKCDAPLCVRPSHLFIATNSENIKDMWNKGRGNRWKKARGEKHHRAKLASEEIVEIRRLYTSGVSSRCIGAKFLMTHVNVLAIVNRKTWKHI